MREPETSTRGSGLRCTRSPTVFLPCAERWKLGRGGCRRGTCSCVGRLEVLAKPLVHVVPRPAELDLSEDAGGRPEAGLARERSHQLFRLARCDQARLEEQD